MTPSSSSSSLLLSRRAVQEPNTPRAQVELSSRRKHSAGSGDDSMQGLGEHCRHVGDAWIQEHIMRKDGQHFPLGWGGIKQTDSRSGQPSSPLLSKYWIWRHLPNPSEMTAFLQREVKVNLHRGASAAAPGLSQGAQDRPFTLRCKCGVNVV